MSNNGRITLCPFYKNEKNLSISCEDIYRTFASTEDKKNHMDYYCDNNWIECPYSKELDRLYNQIGGNEEMNTIERLRHNERALIKELRSVSTILGKTKRREEEKDRYIKELQRQLSSMKRLYILTKNKLDECRKNEEIIYEQIMEMQKCYEEKMASIDGFKGEE